MNRTQRRAERFTKAGRRDHSERTRHICEHGNWMKTDGNGDPMCPHGCGFRSANESANANPQVGSDHSGAETVKPANPRCMALTCPCRCGRVVRYWHVGSCDGEACGIEATS